MTAPDLWPTKDEVTQIVAHGHGMWKTCCGCHESNEGHQTGPIHPALQCVVGSGCHECGGIGAVWDTTDYADMADFLMREEAPATPPAIREGALREAEKVLRDWQDDLYVNRMPETAVAVGMAADIVADLITEKPHDRAGGDA